VLGSERHESRRIDNQLRGRAGRQGDPGESRFYLSLEDDFDAAVRHRGDELGDGAGPPRGRPHRGEDGDQGHRAGAEHGRGAQLRDPQGSAQVRRGHDEQRKVIYALRLQVIDGEDLEERTGELLDGAIESLVASACRATTRRLGARPAARRGPAVLPTKFVLEDLAEASSTEVLRESLLDEALAYYAEHSASLPGGKETAARSSAR